MSETRKERRTGRRGLLGLGAAGALALAVLALLIPTPGGDSVVAPVGTARATAQEPAQVNNHYIGALHEHSGYSDGYPGTTPRDYYASAKGFGLDFLGSSEHSDNSDLPAVFNENCAKPENVDQCPIADPDSPEDSFRKWAATQEQAQAATDDSFTGFRGFEWTNNRYGHINSSPVWVRAGGPEQPRGEWVAGDLHVHTPYSHDSYGGPGDDNTGEDEAYLLGASVERNFENAARRGLDYLAITDHNDIRSQSDPGFGAAGVVPIPGYENSLNGHAQMLGAQKLYYNGDGSTEAVTALANSLRADGGVFQANHPAYRSEDFPNDAHWKYLYDLRPDTVEVWNQASNGTNADAVGYWEGWLDRGEKVGATGASDSHYEATSAALLGSPTTWIFVTEKSERGILEGLRSGRTFLSERPPSEGGARVFLEADADGDGVYEAMVGDTAPAGAALRARVEGAAGSYLRVLTDGGEQAFEPVQVTGDSFEHRFELPAGSTWARAEAYDPGVEEGLEASCEAPEGSDGTKCGGRLTARAMTSAIYLKDAPPEILPVRPLPGSTTGDRTPKIVATVRDAASDLTKSDISLSVDGRKTTFDYDRASDRLGRSVGPLDYGKHTVKVTASDGGNLVAAESWSFKVLRR